MSDRNHNVQEDRAIEQAWNQAMAADPLRQERRALYEGEAPAPGLVREYTELFGLLAYEVAVEAPSPQVKEAIMARVAADAIGSTAPVVPFERPARKVAAPRPVWRYAQAAVLAASLVGLGFLSATVRQQNQKIAELNNQVGASALEQDEVLRVRDEMRRVRNRLDMVTTVARKAYPLRTVSAPSVGAAQKPEGIVYVCGAHQRWYLSLHGLEPPPDDGEYHLWFMTEEGKVDGGVLDVGPDAASEMEAQSMPKDTSGFLVTLEKPGQPESLTILLGESAINL